MDQAVLEQRESKQREPKQRERTHGHGANGYLSNGRQWADRLLQSRIQNALEESGYEPLRNLGVTVDKGEVVLRGRLPSYYLTQLALTKAMRVEGVAQVRHEIQVNSHLN
jgi:osmotically-inducible protein OsmY